MLRAASLLFFALLTNSALAATESNKPEVLGVLFYADWCGSCKVLDPTIEKARDQFNLDNESVLFIRLDLTDETDRYQSSLMAHALGIDAFYTDNAGATGFMLLVDADTGAVITRLTKAMDAEQISLSVQSAIAQASS